MRGHAAVFARLIRRPPLRRAVVAFAAFNIAEVATWIAILVYAFNRGGATEAGVVALAQLLPAAIVAPVGAAIADRYGRDRALAATYLIQAAAMTATGAALAFAAPPLAVYALAAVTASSITLTRPVHSALLPALSRTPDELTAANVASGTVQHASWLVGPVVTGALLTIGGAAIVFGLCAAGTLGGALLVAGTRGDAALLRPAAPGGQEGPWREFIAGFSAIAHLRESRVVAALLAAAAVIEGALDVFIVVLALDLLAIGEAGVGLLGGALGAGGLLGVVLALGLIGRVRLARPFASGLLLWGFPLVVVGLIPTTAAAVLLLVVVGIGRSLLDVAGRTLLQRVTPDASLARVFGVLEGMYMALIGVGAIAVPVLTEIVGPRGAFVVAGLWIPVVLLLFWRVLVAVDAAAPVRHREVALLRNVAMFASLSGPALERLAQQVSTRAAEPGTALIRQGDPGDAFYVIGDGSVDVLIDGRHVRVEGAGESFGEIALLRDVPRTATVIARERVELARLSREAFLEALAGHPAGRRTAEDVVADRLRP